jgi:hypothetical protein
MDRQINFGNSAMCTSGQAPQTAEHILKDCSEYDILRQTQWPRETTLESKLYGLLCELQKTYRRQHCRYKQYFMRTKEEEEDMGRQISSYRQTRQLDMDRKKQFEMDRLVHSISTDRHSIKHIDIITFLDITLDLT